MADKRQDRRDAVAQQDGYTKSFAPGSLKNYKPIPGKPGFYDDGFGHWKFDPYSLPSKDKDVKQP